MSSNILASVFAMKKQSGNGVIRRICSILVCICTVHVYTVQYSTQKCKNKQLLLPNTYIIYSNPLPHFFQGCTTYVINVIQKMLTNSCTKQLEDFVFTSYFLCCQSDSNFNGIGPDLDYEFYLTDFF